jgi:hypothetical protein
LFHHRSSGSAGVGVRASRENRTGSVLFSYCDNKHGEKKDDQKSYHDRLEARRPQTLQWSTQVSTYKPFRPLQSGPDIAYPRLVVGGKPDRQTDNPDDVDLKHLPPANRPSRSCMAKSWPSREAPCSHLLWLNQASRSHGIQTPGRPRRNDDLKTGHNRPSAE